MHQFALVPLAGLFGFAFVVSACYTTKEIGKFVSCAMEQRRAYDHEVNKKMNFIYSNLKFKPQYDEGEVSKSDGAVSTK